MFVLKSTPNLIPPNFQHLLQSPHQTAQLPWFTNSAGVLAACGSILYCFEGQAMVLPMENKIKRPSEMVGTFGVLSTGMALTSIFDAAVGFLGYSKFGSAIQGSVTLNLPAIPLLTFVKLVCPHFPPIKMHSPFQDFHGHFLPRLFTPTICHNPNALASHQSTSFGAH